MKKVCVSYFGYRHDHVCNDRMHWANSFGDSENR